MATYNGHQEDSSGNYLLAIPNSMATTIETGTTASQAYTKGTYFYYNNRLVKATQAIASGDTLTVGTNVGYANAADELTAHLRANDTNKSEFYFDVKDGAYGFYPSASKTASEFVPFGGTPKIAYPVIGIDYEQFLTQKSAMRTFRTTGNRTVQVDSNGICRCGGSYSGSVAVYWESPFDLSGCTHGMCVAWLQSNDGASVVMGISLSNTLNTSTGTPQFTPYTAFEIPSGLDKSRIYLKYHHNHVSQAFTAWSLLYDILFW